MTITVNHKSRETAATTLAGLIDELALPLQGTAVASGGSVIPRTDWDGYALHEGLDLLIIRAACGG